MVPAFEPRSLTSGGWPRCACCFRCSWASRRDAEIMTASRKTARVATATPTAGPARCIARAPVRSSRAARPMERVSPHNRHARQVNSRYGHIVGPRRAPASAGGDHVVGYHRERAVERVSSLLCSHRVQGVGQPVPWWDARAGWLGRAERDEPVPHVAPAPLPREKRRRAVVEGGPVGQDGQCPGPAASEVGAAAGRLASHRASARSRASAATGGPTTPWHADPFAVWLDYAEQAAVGAEVGTWTIVPCLNARSVSATPETARACWTRSCTSRSPSASTATPKPSPAQPRRGAARRGR
jgi:hypothetical protein